MSALVPPSQPAMHDDASLLRHDESVALVRATVAQVFAHLDDPQVLAAHMGESSMMMLGSRMSMDVDAGGGRRVGSRIRMHGRVMGIAISLDEVVTERHVPHRKLWETIGNPRLLVLARYRMGFELQPRGDLTLLRVFIDYSLPATAPTSWLGRWLGGFYARWCTRQMAAEAARHFDAAPPPRHPGEPS